MLYCEQQVKKLNSFSNLKVLIVEDSEVFNKKVYEKLLEKNFLQVTQAYSLKDATSKIENDSFDIIILDLNLPDSYGEDLVNSIKSISEAKIIILTSEKDVHIRETLFKSGILDYVVKDKNFEFSLKGILSTIESLETNKNSTILIIDDSLFMCKQLQNLLSIRNYNSIVVHKAKDGFEILKDQNISLIILDLDLPDVNGLDLLRMIKDEDRFCHIPIIMLSGSYSAELIRDCLKTGASDFIKKPFQIEEFILKVAISVEMNRKHTEVLCKQKMLNEYKDVVDKSFIVSKTDTKGIITFVNEKFCEISGYTKDELMGKPHNIVRHPDMPKEAFKELWETIKSKQVWHGKIKNRKKDGGFYYVQSIINPIVDYDGNIVEYIAIRDDITDLESIKEELEKDLNITEKNFKKAYRLSQEYHKAIEVSNMLFRVDLNMRITFVNDLLCEISGYSRDELIGKSYEVLNKSTDLNKIIKIIKSGKIWKGRASSKKKNGATYFVETTIVPIKDENENIIEFLGIRHDITEIVNIHKEIEDTQKEIIYKMGEIGESRSRETGNHVKRVAEYSKLLALLAGLGKKNAELLYIASPMHDIGKVGIPDSVLNKPGRLNEEEWEIMKTHSEIGYKILKNSKRPILRAAALIAYRHHEKWDGSGYPCGIAGEKIHIFGRITAIADVFDALGSDRAYKKAWELERILELFKSERGKHFDPNLTDIFFNNLDKFLEIREKYKDT